MKIFVKTNDSVKFALLLPNFLIFNRLTASLLPKMISSKTEPRDFPIENLGLNSAAVRKLILELGRIKRKYGHFTLVDVVCANGDIVKIVL